jgi:hypothetical protein
MTRIISIAAACMCLSSCAEFYMANKTYIDTKGNQITTTKQRFTMYERTDYVRDDMVIPCLDSYKAHYYEKNKYVVNGCWYYAEEKIIFIGFDNITREFKPQWKLQNLTKY